MALSTRELGIDFIQMVGYEGELYSTFDWIEQVGITLLHADGKTPITREDLEASESLRVYPESMLLFVNTAINMQDTPVYQNEPDRMKRVKLLATAKAIIDSSR
jgi:hypothetical protein